jgi:2-methylcitrate dehydratase PrpD
MPPFVVENLAVWINAVRYDDIPERVRDRARQQLASIAAGLRAGARTEAAQCVRRAVSAWNKPGRCTIAPTGEKTALHEAVLANCACSMSLDYDDYLFLGHTGHSAVLASLAVGEELGLGGRDVLAAQIVANEIGGRLGASVVLGPQNGQAWSFIHAAEAAAATAHLYGLTAAQTAHALALALYQPSFTLWPGFMGPDSKALTAAWPAVVGVQAAQFAREGLTGALDIIENARHGFWRHFAFAPLPQMMAGLGEVWVTDTLAIKKHPGCAYVSSALDALFGVLAQFRDRAGRSATAADIARLDVDAGLFTIEMDNLAADAADPARLRPVEINFSIPLTMATGALAGRLTGAEMQQDWLDRRQGEIRELAARVRLSHDWSMTRQTAEAFGWGLDGRKILDTLSFADLSRVAAGYRRQMGGPKRISLDLPRAAGAGDVALFGGAGRNLARRLGLAGPRRLADPVRHFQDFRMVFPARVTLTASDGATFSARQDSPSGASGQNDLAETARQKFLTEAGADLTAAQAKKALKTILRAENISAATLAKAVCVAR